MARVLLLLLLFVFAILSHCYVKPFPTTLTPDHPTQPRPPQAFLTPKKGGQAATALIEACAGIAEDK